MKRRSKSAGDGKVWLAFKWIVAVALAGCVLYGLGSRLARPITLYSRETGEVRKISRDLQAIRIENEGLRRTISYMNTPEGKAQAARWAGMVKKGERRLIIPED